MRISRGGTRHPDLSPNLRQRILDQHPKYRAHDTGHAESASGDFFGRVPSSERENAARGKRAPRPVKRRGWILFGLKFAITAGLIAYVTRNVDVDAVLRQL